MCLFNCFIGFKMYLQYNFTVRSDLKRITMFCWPTYVSKLFFIVSCFRDQIVEKQAENIQSSMTVSFLGVKGYTFVVIHTLLENVSLFLLILFDRKLIDFVFACIISRYCFAEFYALRPQIPSMCNSRHNCSSGRRFPSVLSCPSYMCKSNDINNRNKSLWL